MKKYTLISSILEAPKLKELVDRVLDMSGYEETGRKVTLFTLFQYFLLNAIVQFRSYRELSKFGRIYGLPEVDYSTLSKKAAEVSYELVLKICKEILNSSCRQKRRELKKETQIIIKAVDSTRITACASKWTWAPYLRESSGLKFHVAFLPELGLPSYMEVSEIHEGDTVRLAHFKEKHTILVCDRGYMNAEKFYDLDTSGQSFIIRLRNTVNFQNERPTQIDCNEMYTDRFGTLSKHRDISKEARNQEYRIISFVGANGENVTLCTNLRELSADTIAAIYKERWSIECFFRTLKQNFSIKQLFGKTANAAFTQGIIAFIAYVLLYKVHDRVLLAYKRKSSTLVPVNYSGFTRFLRALRFDDLYDFPLKIVTVRNCLLP